MLVGRIALWCCFILAAAASHAASLRQEVYVWQRDWNPTVHEAIVQHTTNFSRLVALNAEVTWRQKQPQLIRVPLDYALLADTKCEVGLTLRIGPYAGPFATNDPAALYLANLAGSLVREATAKRVPLREFQLDFDCAESKLAGYRAWLEVIRAEVKPTPLTITALPAWLKQPAFKSLVEATDGYVLQVHSLDRPKTINARFTLCDPTAAQRAVEQAGKFNVPFRVALPTYGYLMAFDSAGRFIGLSAEGPAKKWPAGAQIREARADPIELAALVQSWSSNHPGSLGGIIWYRLPTRDDVLNLRWPTLVAMMAGRSPKESFRAEPRHVEPGLIEISLVNEGEFDISSRLAIEVHWSREGGTRLVAGDGLQGFEMVDAAPSTVKFRTKSQMYRLPAGERQVIGWLRLTQDREVNVEIEKLSFERAGSNGPSDSRLRPGVPK